MACQASFSITASNVAFFFLSVVPLAAVTLVTYASNARAMREAAGRESELLAGELSQRMQVVTALVRTSQRLALSRLAAGPLGRFLPAFSRARAGLEPAAAV